MAGFNYEALREEVSDFAAREIAPREELSRRLDFPADLWSAMGDAGLMSIALPLEFGGRAGDYRAIALTLETLADVGGCQGVAISWMSQALNARMHILGLGTDEQKTQYLPGLAAGRHTVCMAISEPGAGAHPKKLSTRAVPDGGDIILNGEKTYLTNGPLADLFLVLAITDEIEGRRQFTSFIVPRDTPGVEQTSGVEVDFLHPSPHCGLKLTDVRIPNANRLGPLGGAFNAISLPMRRVEDALGAAKTAGAMRHRFNLLCKAAAKRKVTEEIEVTLGLLSTMPEDHSAMAWRAAELLDSGREDTEETLMALAGAARQTGNYIEGKVEAFINAWDIEVSDALAIANRDLVKSQGIAGYARDLQARKRGQALLSTVV